MGAWHFVKEAFKDFRHVAALFPSSRYAAHSVAANLPGNVETIIEFGAGDGPVTRALLERLPKHGRLVAVELNHHLVRKLRRLKDHRLKVIRGDAVSVAVKLKGIFPGGVDAVVSGIPCSFLQLRKREAFVRAISSHLHKGGRFIAYQTSLRILPLMKKYFSRTRWILELRNLPVYFIMIAIKQK